MRYLTVREVITLHSRIIEQSGGATGISNVGGLESALAQPRMTFSGEDLYPTIVEKTAMMGFALIKNHPFVEGNKRIAHAAMEVFLILNGFEINTSVDEQERIILQVASGKLDKEEFTNWLRIRIVEKFSKN